MTPNPAFRDRLQRRRAGLTGPAAADGPDAAGALVEGAAGAPLVLVVDDEPEITRSVTDLLDRAYEVRTASSADEGLELIRQHDFSVILTDQRMPGGTGAELLARSLDLAPETTRILFTGYSDISAVIEAVNEGHVYRYVTKPWRPEELKAVVASGVERHRLVTDNRRLLADLTRANEELAVANRELEAFAHAVAHDVRAPLRAIDGYSAMVLRDASGVLPGPSQDHLRNVREAAQHMGVLIDDLLDLSRATRGELLLEDTDVSAVAASVLDELREAEPSRRFEAVVMPGVRAMADRLLLRVILANLLGNAWKFTGGHKTARIEFGTVERDGVVTCFVRDDGAGFDPRYAARLFEPFGRLHTAEAFEGVGMGLAATRRLVARHGGRVWAESEVEQGATFFFTLSAPA